MRAVVNMILYQNRTGCQWDMVPHDLLPEGTVSDDFARWRDDGPWQRILDARRAMERQAEGRVPTPRAGRIDSRSVNTTEMGRTRLRRRQGTQGSKTSYPRGHRGVAVGSGGDVGDGRSRGLGPSKLLGQGVQAGAAQVDGGPPRGGVVRQLGGA